MNDWVRENFGGSESYLLIDALTIVGVPAAELPCGAKRSALAETDENRMSW